MSRLFNGTSDYLTAAVGLLFVPQSGFTVSAWVKPVSVAANESAVAYGSTIASDYWCLFHTAAAVTSFERAHTSSSDSTGGTMTTGTWQHMAAVSASLTSGIVYRNGTAGTTDATSQAMASMNTLDIGRLLINNAAFDFYSGRIGEVAVWSTALSAAQVLSLSQGANPTTLSSGSLVGYWQIKGSASPEPFYPGFGTLNMTVTGTTAEVGDDPPVQPAGLLPELTMAPMH